MNSHIAQMIGLFRTHVLRVMSASILCLCAIGALGAAACAQKPTLQVQHAQITGIDLIGVNVNVLIRVYNPNNFDVLVRNIQAQTTLAGAYTLPPIQMQPNAWLPSNKTTYLSAPVVVPWHMVPSVLSASLGNEFIAYQVNGTADVSASRTFELEVNKQPLDDHGVISREMMLQAARPRMPGIY